MKKNSIVLFILVAALSLLLFASFPRVAQACPEDDPSCGEGAPPPFIPPPQEYTLYREVCSQAEDGTLRCHYEPVNVQDYTGRRTYGPANDPWGLLDTGVWWQGLCPYC